MHGYNMAKCYGHIERYVGLHRSGMHKGLRLCFAVCGDTLFKVSATVWDKAY